MVSSTGFIPQSRDMQIYTGQQYRLPLPSWALTTSYLILNLTLIQIGILFIFHMSYPLGNTLIVQQVFSSPFETLHGYHQITSPCKIQNQKNNVELYTDYEPQLSLKKSPTLIFDQVRKSFSVFQDTSESIVSFSYKYVLHFASLQSNHYMCNICHWLLACWKPACNWMF